MKTNRKELCILLVLGLILGIHRGYIALWHDDASDPCKVFPYKADLLPPTEQVQLAEGIRIRDGEHLCDLLMNYLS